MLITNKNVGVGLAGHKGRGVYALAYLKRGTTIEVCPVIFLGVTDTENLSQTILNDYVYEADDGRTALALGYGSLYNHSDTPNAHFDLNPSGILVITAIRDIESKQEICIDYGGKEAEFLPSKGKGKKR